VRIVDPEDSCKKKWTAIYLVAATDEGDSVVPGSLQVEGGLLKVWPLRCY